MRPVLQSNLLYVINSIIKSGESALSILNSLFIAHIKEFLNYADFYFKNSAVE